MEPYDTGTPADCFADAKNSFNCLIGQLADPATEALAHDRLEEMLAEQGRELLRQLLQAHLDLRAERERRSVACERGRGAAALAGADQVVRSRVETGHHRQLATIFGTVTVTRCAWRAPGAANLYPADAALALPAGRHSHGLARLAAVEAVRGSFDAAKAAIEARCGPVIGKRQIEQQVCSAAVDIDAFYAQRIPLPRTADELLVLSLDGKGVVMRPEALRPATAKAAARTRRIFRTRLAGGEKPCRKRMAALGVVYDAAPAPRRPHDVIAVPGGRTGDRPLRPGPKAKRKWLHGSLVAGPDEVIATVFDHAEARDPLHARTWVVLVDGARHQLDLIGAEADRRGVDIHIVIDVIHVIEYLWKAAWCLHAADDPAAEDWVATCALALLAGNTEQVTASIDACIRYLTGHAEFLRYDQALNNGWPIATGVIEGACRHLIGDRLEITGARWGLAGAEAILKLRAVISCEDFPAYWRYHLDREHERIHQARYQDRYTLTA